MLDEPKDENATATNNKNKYKKRNIWEEMKNWRKLEKKGEEKKLRNKEREETDVDDWGGKEKKDVWK